MHSYYIWTRTIAMARKEAKELFHDPATLVLIFLIPIFQVVLFAYSINSNPKHLATAIIAADNSPITRSIINDLSNSSYFKILPGNYDSKSVDHLFKTEKAQFALHIPPNFTKDLIHKDKPQLLMEADGTDPAAISYALGAFGELSSVFTNNLTGPLSYLQVPQLPIKYVVHSKYNPNRITQYNIVPGLLSSVLSMTLVLVTALAVVRENEAGTMEVLLTTPLRPTEIILGKIIPYIVMAYVQAIIILALARFLFEVPIIGSIWLLLFSCFPFILACLTIGILFSTRATNQIQAAQATSLYFLPAILFSGFLFPFSGLPNWGQFIGNLLPPTHFLTIIRGIMLKGSGFIDIYPSLLAILAIFSVLLIVAIAQFRQTLD